MKKFYQIAIVIVAAIAFAACGNKASDNGETADSTATEQTAEATDEVKEGSMGPCTVSCEKFSIDIPEGWEVRSIEDKAISAGQEYKEGLEFVYDDRANYAQERQFKMDKNGMEDLGEKTYGDNTYATYLWKQGSDSTFSAILKIGDGESSVIKVNTTNVKTADNETVIKVLGSLKLK